VTTKIRPWWNPLTPLSWEERLLMYWGGWMSGLVGVESGAERLVTRPPARPPCMWQGRQPEELHWARSREGCGMFLDTRILRFPLTPSRLPSSSHNHCWWSRDCNEITIASVQDMSSDPNVTFSTQCHRINKQIDLSSGKSLWPYSVGKFYPNRW